MTPEVLTEMEFMLSIVLSEREIRVLTKHLGLRRRDADTITRWIEGTIRGAIVNYEAGQFEDEDDVGPK
jgi:hypothetical protein